MSHDVLYNPLTRPHWGGAESNVDNHLEIYDAAVDSMFEYTQMFKSMSAQRSTANRSNQIRIDRLGASKVLARRSGEKIIDQRVTSDKLNVVVDTMLYIRNAIDYTDDWTAPDFQSDYGRNNGTSFAIAFDEAHIIQLQKAPEWKAPDHLKANGAFYDGLSQSITIVADASSTAALEANADAIIAGHARVVNELIRRRVPMTDMVTIMDTEMFSTILNSKKLINQDYSANNGDFAGRRALRINGIPVVEMTTFPTEATAEGEHHLLSSEVNDYAFDSTAETIKGKVIVFSKSQALVTVFAHDWVSRVWDDKAEMCNVLDCYSMLTVALKRPDAVGVLRITETAVEEG